MKVVFLLAVGVACLFLFSCNRHPRNIPEKVSVQELKPVAYKKLPKKEAVAARLWHERQMIADPALKSVPVERLEVARRQLRSMQVNPSDRNSPLSALVWNERGPNNQAGRARSVIFDIADVTNNTVYVGSVSGGLWKTTNFLAATPTWTQVASVSANLAISALKQDPSSPNIMYAGTGEGYPNYDAVNGLGIYKSIDGGTTWNLLASTTTGGANELDFGFVQDIEVYSNGHVYASAITASEFCNYGGILKSSNGGASWTRVIGSLTGGDCTSAHDFFGYDLEISTGGDIYASVIDRAGAFGYLGNVQGKIFKSPAGASVGNVGTWSNITPAAEPGNYWQRIELACAPSNNNVVYAMMQDAGNGIDSIMRSADGGATWSNADNTTLWCDGGDSTTTDFSRGTQAWYDLILAVQPNNDQVVLAGAVDIMKSSNGGANWTQNTQWASGCATLPNVHADIHGITFLPGSNSQYVVVTDGGIFYSPDNGITYVPKNNGLRTIQYYSADMHPASGSNYLLGGTQDNGTHQFSSAGLTNAVEVFGGDGGFTFIDRDDPSIQIVSTQNVNYGISRDGGATFNIVAAFGDPTFQRFINPADYDHSANLLYAGYDPGQILRMSNIASGVVGGQSLSIPSAGTDRSVSAVKVDPNTNNQVYVAFSTRPFAPGQTPLLYRLTNAHATPVATAVNLPSLGSGQYISCIDIENGNANHILITLSNYGINSIYETLDGGANWISLDNNGVNLPDMPVRWAAFVPSGYNVGLAADAIGGILIATEMGVMSTSVTNGLSTVWSINSNGMGNVRTDMLRLRDADKVVAVATHGRGMFTGTLFAGAFPVTFLGFSGKAENRINKLIWETSDEINNHGFEVQRKSPTGEKYETVGFVTGKNSSGKHIYTFSDASFDLGRENHSYRLKQVDFDKRSIYSPIVTINRKASRRMVEYVSVTGNNLFFRINNNTNSDRLTLRIFDASGKMMLSHQLSYQSQSVDISRLAKGTYVVEIADKHQRHTQRFVR